MKIVHLATFLKAYLKVFSTYYIVSKGDLQTTIYCTCWFIISTFFMSIFWAPQPPRALKEATEFPSLSLIEFESSSLFFPAIPVFSFSISFLSSALIRPSLSFMTCLILVIFLLSTLFSSKRPSTLFWACYLFCISTPSYAWVFSLLFSKSLEISFV